MSHVKASLVATATLLAVLPSFSFAQTQNAANSQGLSGVYVDCVEASGANTWSKLECANLEIARLDRAVGATYRTVLETKSLSDARALRRDQQAWLRARDAGCDQKLAALRPEFSSVVVPTLSELHAYEAQSAQCRLEETQRRAAWLQNAS